MLTQMFTRINLVWLVLLAATVASWHVGQPWTGGIVVIMAFVKVRFVALDFMELRHAPRWLRWLIEVWAVVLGSVLVVLLSRASAA